MLNRIALTIVFTLSFAAYLGQELTVPRRFAPLLLFGILVFLKVLCSKSALRALGTLLDSDALVYLFFLSFLTIGSSMASDFDQSLQYWLLTTVTLLLARLYMAVVPLTEVLEAFFWSGVLSVGLFMAMAFVDLAESVLSVTRFTAFAFEPNVLAFVLAGYFCAAVWKFATGAWRMKILASLLGSVCLAIIFFASSRGSLVALVVGGLFVAAMAILGAPEGQRRKFLRRGVLAATLLLAAVLAAVHLGWGVDAYDYTDQVLSLSTPERGVDSGFTGRFDNWDETLHTLSDGSWWMGRGLRSSDTLPKPIDNSYLVILYELGLFPLLLIAWRFFSIARKFQQSYGRATERSQREFYRACSLLMVVFLMNDIVGRFMFALANPYSLLAFLLFAAPTSHWELSAEISTSDSSLPGRPIGCPGFPLSS